MISASACSSLSVVVSRTCPENGILGSANEVAELVGGVDLRDVMHVDHRRLNVRVTHVGLHIGEREHLDGERPECMPQVVQSKARESGALERIVEPAAQPPVVHVSADVVDKDEVGGVGEAFRRDSPSRAFAAWSISGTLWTLPDFGPPSAP
jgi:hypothetical protein